MIKRLAWISLGLSLIVAGLFFTHTFTSINQDIGRHLKMGEVILQFQEIPKTNLFSFTEPDHPFINHHWLSEVIFYLLHLKIGLTGLIIFKAIILTLALLTSYFAVKNRASILAFTLALAPSLLVLSNRTDVRPEIFSYLFLALFLFIIFKAKYEDKLSWLYTLPFIQVVWTNAHIYFAFGPFLIVLFAVERYISNDSAWKKVSLIAGLVTVGTLLNPNGILGALAPLTILAEYGYSIVENQSIFFLKDYGILGTQINIFLLASIIFIASFVPALKRVGFRSYFFETVVSLVFLILAAKMIRNFGPLGIVMANILPINIQAYLEKYKLNYFLLYFLSITVSVILLFAVLTSSIYPKLGLSSKFGLEIPASAQRGVNFVKENNLKGPVFNNFDVGSYLIWKLYPEQRVFVDGRPEAYSVEFFKEVYKPMQENPQLWKEYSDKYNIQYIFFDYRDITPWAQAFLFYISKDKNWPLVYKDNAVVIFVRKELLPLKD